LGNKEVGGLLVIILQFYKRKTETERIQPAIAKKLDWKGLMVKRYTRPLGHDISHKDCRAL
jgi:hypothetical protein